MPSPPEPSSADRVARREDAVGERTMTETVNHFIAGKSVAGTSGRFGDVYNPATGERSRRVALADAGEVDAAVKAATAAFPAWAATPPLTRARVLFRFRELLGLHQDEFA